MLYEHGPGNGTLLVLPLDQGLEHGPTDFLPNPAALDTSFQCRLAIEGRFSAIAFGIGLAEKYADDYLGRVPLILKLNGKTNIPPDDDAVSPLIASVEDAVRLGADAIGYTLYIGTPRQDFEFLQFSAVRRDAERFGMPMVVWAYPRGSAIEAKGGKGGLFAIDYAARVAEEVGADVVKLHEPEPAGPGSPDAYRNIDEDAGQRLARVVRSAGRSLVLFSGGSRMDGDRAVAKVDLCMRSGATGIIFGRNLWQRSYAEALALTARVHDVLANYPG